MDAPPVPRMPSWAPPLPAEPSRPNPPSRPPLSVLRTVFDWVYLTLPAAVWDLPLQGQSDAILRAAATACRSLTPGSRGFDHMVAEPEAFLGEYLTLRALACVDIEDWLCDLHYQYPDEPFVACYYDPR